MDFDEFRQLENKINRVLEKLEILKQENSELRASLDKLQMEYNEKAAALEETTLELKRARENMRDPAKEEKIRSKVSGLLEKLEKY